MFRNNIIEELGFLQKGTREANRAKKYFDATVQENNYYKKDGSIDFGKYCYDIRENEALVAQDMVTIKLTDGYECYPKILKQSQEALMEFSPDKNIELQEIQKQSKELSSKGITFKELLSYLFD